MRRISAIAVVGMLALAMAGCGSDEEPAASISPAPQPVAKTQPAPKPFAKPPVVPQEPIVKISSGSGLIQSTNGNQRAKQVEKGRKDPFGGLFAPVVIANVPTPTPTSTTITLAPTPSKTASSSRSQKTASAPTSPKTAASRSSKPSTPPPPPKSVAVAPPPVPLPSVAPAPPLAEPIVPPQADLAKEIIITGIVQIGDEIQAIIQVPNEGTSRYVREGQMLSNGQVLIKRIEVNRGAQPLVILEEKGIEVAKAVGEAPANSDQKNTPTAAAPSYSPASSRNSPPPSFSPSNNTGTPTNVTGPGSIRRGYSQPPSSSSPQPNNISPPTTTTPSPPPTSNNDDDSEEER